MPELPEMETLRRDIDREVGGKRIKTVDVPGRTAVSRMPKKQLIERLDGVKISSADRRGLLLALKLDSGELLVIDLRAGGRLRKTTPREAVEKGTQIVISFTQGGQLRMIDPDDGLSVWVATPGELLEQEPVLTRLGLDPVVDPISWTTFGHMLLARAQPIKAFLTDATAVVGIGPVYSDEIMWQAGLRHDRESHLLTSQEMRRLYRAVVETLHDGAKHRGTTLADGRYHDLAGKPGGYQTLLQVYDRAGKACNRCRGTITKVRYHKSQLFMCPDCQV
ncbi:Fpg/Nei family DNA glycosylase [Iamia sp.]|uniref:Fpg/Nei family DNA glycosylase n=1 Tax=Iamia sp. TaxID=2722710 RepID=UPI002B5B9F87|nr:DNA-formamidopyrimidine glycosylase family protein [Iamia sp.]HXH55990.1 DNA-formamidopyrimidine glycosylase family protein [Iamia sp.]